MPKIHTKKFWLAGGAAALVALVLVLLEVTGTTHIFHHEKTLIVEPSSRKTGNSQTKGEPSQPSTNDTGPNSSNNGDGTSSGTNEKPPSNGPTQNATLLAPDGVFASSHHVSLSSTISSNCTTTAGATCEIILTKDGVVKTIGSQQTDRGGSAYWSWQPKDIGLAGGTWTITAKAQLGSQTKQTDDALKLEVSP